jgi:hypothetical protein
MKLWIDDDLPAPDGYTLCKTVNEAKNEILKAERLREKFLKMAKRGLERHDLDYYHVCLKIANRREIELIDLDYDAGEYAADGGDYIRLLEWLEETRRNYPIRIHSTNPVGIINMKRIIQKNGWKEIT